MTTLSAQEKSYLKEIKAVDLSQQSLREFCELYMACESTARKLIEYHNKTKKANNANNANKKEEKSDFILSEIKDAVKYYSLTIDKEVIDRIFKAGSGRRNSKTCRQLRNKLFHELSKKDKEEIIDRFVDLKSDMDTWLALF